MAHLAIIGAGNMAEAIVRGLIGGGVYTPRQMIAADVSAERRELFLKQLSISAVDSPATAARGASTILLSVKPQSMKEVLESLAPAIDESALVISIAAGISTWLIQQGLSPKPCRVIRTMPNTPMLVGEGMVAMAPGSRASHQDMETARRIFSPTWPIDSQGRVPAQNWQLVTPILAAAAAISSGSSRRMLRSKPPSTIRSIIPGESEKPCRLVTGSEPA